MVAAGSMPPVVAIFATEARGHVAISTTDENDATLYRYIMFAQWLRQALTAKNVSQEETARRLTEELSRSYDRSMVNKMALGKRNISAAELQALSKVLGYAPPRIDSEQDVTGNDLIPVIGYVGAGSWLVNFDAAGELERIPMIEEGSARTKALEIRGDSLGEVFDRWVVYFDEEGDRPTDAMIGRLCVVRLMDGRMLVKKIKAGTLPGRFTLTSNFDPPIYDADIESVAPVISLRPR